MVGGEAWEKFQHGECLCPKQEAAQHRDFVPDR